jgi:hypothetical protein
VSSQPNNCGILVPKFEQHFRSSLFSLFYLATLTQYLSHGLPWGVILNDKGCKESVVAYFLDICVIKYEQFVSPDLIVLWQPIDRNGAAKYYVIDPRKGSGVSDISITWQNCSRAPTPAEVQSREMAVWTSDCCGSVLRTKAVACCRVYFETLLFTQLVNTFIVWLNS